jgi:hypothetical protein
MAQTMFLGILVLAYIGYLALALERQLPAAWVDWVAPYFHTGPPSHENVLGVFALPVLLAIWIGFSWYRKSMIGEA